MNTPPFPLRDAHLHLAEYGETLGQAQLGGCVSVGEVLGVIARAAAATPTPRWVRAAGLRIEGLRERRAPTASELDEASGGRCVLARSFDHHAMAVSGAALRAARISRASADPAGGVIVRDGTGEPTGLLLEHACDAVWAALPPADDEEYRGWVVAALDDLSRRGFVEVHDMFARARLVGVLRGLERGGGLRARVRLYATAEHFDAVRGACAALAAPDQSLVEFGGLKMFADGTLNSRTAHMLHPFAEPLAHAPCGTALLSRGQIEEGFRRARGAGVGAAVHAIGDAAVRTVLDAVEALGEPAAETRPGGRTIRIEHAQFVDGADVGRFPALQVVCSPQPCHLLTDIEAITRLTPGRAGRAFSLKDLCGAYERAGFDPAAWVWLGSDAPVVPPDPFDNITAACGRGRADAHGVRIAPEQALEPGVVWGLMRASAPVIRG